MISIDFGVETRVDGMISIDFGVETRVDGMISIDFGVETRIGAYEFSKIISGCISNCRVQKIP